MALTDSEQAFIESTPSAGMVTVTPSGVAKAVRVGVAVIDGKLWSSGTEGRMRTRRLRADPHCTLYVHDATWSFLTLETTVTILDGPDASAQNLRMFRQLQATPEGPLDWFGKQYTEEEFLALMAAEQRLIYEFDVQRTYGMIPQG